MKRSQPSCRAFSANRFRHRLSPDPKKYAANHSRTATRQDVSRLIMLTPLDLIEAENDQAQIEGEFETAERRRRFLPGLFAPTRAHIWFMRFMFSRGALVDGPALGQVSFPECHDSVRTAVRYALRRPLVLLIDHDGPTRTR